MKTRTIPIAIILFFVVLALFAGQTMKWVRECKQITLDWPRKCNLLARLALPYYNQVGFVGEHWSYLMGYDHPINYLILLQNDTEMRANGGFFGSYAVATMDSGKPSIRFQDIYAPDGQLGSGHVEAPLPIEEAFHKGGFYLRDSDWDPDFVNSAKTISWFFEKGGEVKPDLIVTISLSTIKKILHIVGPIRLTDYNMEMTEDNIYNLVQAKVESDFFPGSTQKKDILTGLGQALMAKLEFLPIRQKLEIANILWQEVQQKNILVNSTNPTLQTIFEEKEMAGALKYPKCKNGDGMCTLDTFLAVEANLGANKANCCTSRTTSHTISDNGDNLKHDVQIVYTNNSSDENPKLPDFFGGNYIDYVRFYIPKVAENVSVEAEPTLPTTLAYYPTPYSDDQSLLSIEDYYLFKIIGLFHTTRAGTTSRIHIQYELPKVGEDYELHILKQHGMQASPQEIVFGDKRVNTSLANDYVFMGGKITK